MSYSLMNREFRRADSFELEIFCNIINHLTDTFDQFNASLLNKIIISLKKTV